MRRIISSGAAGALLIATLVACGGSEDEAREVPTIMRAQFETQMRTILHDLQAAEEQAAAIEGRYLALQELRGGYFNRPVPENYELSVSEVTTTSYRAEVVHGPSGLRCHLEVGAGGRGSPICD